MNARRAIRLGTLGLLLLGAGCQSSLSRSPAPALRERALFALKQGTHYRALASVRAQAVEALQQAAPRAGLPWIRRALPDTRPGVRFAACVALGTLRDEVSRPALERSLADANASVRAAAVFALHRLGDRRYSPRLAEWLLESHDPTLQRNTALLLGRLGEEGAIPLLARAMLTKDEGLRLQALESMALLGSKEARQQLKFSAYSGDGGQQTFALLALARTHDPALAELYRLRLENAQYLEARLAAARALGELGLRDGYATALKALSFDRPRKTDKNDPPENQIMRVRQLAARALGAIGDPQALPELTRCMDSDPDPRVQLAAAFAIAQITQPRSHRAW